MRKALGLATIFLTTMLAGCVGGESTEVPPPASAAPAVFDEGTGAIQGVVVDDSLAPIANALVGIHGLQEFASSSDQGGAFSFSNVPPGTHTLLAQQIGFEAAAKQVEVPAGAVTTVELVLSPLPSQTPYHQTVDQRGLFGCGSSWRPSLGVPGVLTVGGIAACGATNIVLNDTNHDNFLLLWETNGNDTGSWDAAVFEMEWTSNQALGNGLAVYWEVDGCSNNRTARFALERGDSPLRARLGDVELEERLLNITTHGCDSDDCEEGCDFCNEEKCNLQSRVFSDPDTLGSASAADIGVTFQQTYHQHFTEFYHEEGPEDFTALADA